MVRSLGGSCSRCSRLLPYAAGAFGAPGTLRIRPRLAERIIHSDSRRLVLVLYLYREQECTGAHEMLIITKKVEKYWLITTEEKLLPIVWCPRDFFDFEIGALAFHLQSYTYCSQGNQLITSFYCSMPSIGTNFGRVVPFHMVMTQMYHKSKTNAVP